MEKTFKEKFEERVARDEKELSEIIPNVFSNIRSGQEPVTELVRHLQACIRAYDSCTKFDADGKPFTEAKWFLEKLAES